MNGQPISQARNLEFGSTGRDAGAYTVAMNVSADGYNRRVRADYSHGARIHSAIRQRQRFSGRDLGRRKIHAGRKLHSRTVRRRTRAGGLFRAEGSVSGNEFDSTGVRFDPANTSEQQKTITIMAKVADDQGSGSAQTSVVVKQKGAITAKRFPDIVFPSGSARVNNCGKRVLLEELKSSLDSDPNGHVVFVGHTSQNEKGRLTWT